MPMSLSRRNQQINSRRSKLDYISIYSKIKELTIYLLLKKLQLSFLKMGCHDLAKQLSQYLYFFSFPLLLLLRWSMGKYHMTVTKSQKRCDSGHRMLCHSHSMWQRSQLINMRTMGDKIHSCDSNCIYSVANLTRTLSSSLCQLLNKKQLALFWLGV